MDNFFHLKEHNTTVKTEVAAGITTFMAMAYILVVNSGMFAELGVVSYGAIYIATAISAIVGTLLIGLLANLPLAQASGMGLNAFFVYTVCFGMGLSYANALTLVLLDGIVFIILTVTGLRKLIFDAIPKCVKMAVPVGIGLFIAFLGLQNAGLVVKDEATAVNLVSLNLLNGNATWASVMPILVMFGSIIVIAVLAAKKKKGAVLWGIIAGTVAYYVLGFTVKGFYDGFRETLEMNPFAAFSDFSTQAFGKVFTKGFDFSAYLAEHSQASLVVLIITTALAFCMVDMFDTLGTLFGACSQGNLVDKDGNVPNMNRAMLADAIATTVGSVCGTSTVTTFVESSAGIAEGGRTGLSAVVTAAAFFVAMFFSPIAALIPTYAVAAALVYVGVLMASGAGKISWNNAEEAVPAFFTLAMMPFTYNISYGIAFGLLSYVLIQLFSGKAKQIRVGTWVITILFTVMFFVTH